VARNWRCPDGELDLVVRRGNTIAICEVKTRRTAAFGAPQEAVTVAKQRRIRRLAAQWLAEQRRGGHLQGPADLRFDVAAVTATEVAVIEEAF
jgi:putative endonuclease